MGPQVRKIFHMCSERRDLWGVFVADERGRDHLGLPAMVDPAPLPSPALHVVLMTCPEESAEALLRQLLEERLVGCGNILPAVRSLYWWEGELCADAESLVIMETTSERLPALLTRAPELHPYDVPKVVALDASASARPYVAWLRSVTAAKE